MPKDYATLSAGGQIVNQVGPGTTGICTRILGMDQSEQERLRGRLARLRRLLLQTADPAVATALSDDIADIETRLRAAQSPNDLRANDPN